MLVSASEVFDVGLPTALLPKPPSFMDFSAEGVLAPAPRDDSNGLPAGDLGVFAEDPNAAKAPVPRAKALDAPPVGDAILPPGVVMELNGLDFPCEELSPPNRLVKVVRPEGLSPWLPDPNVLRERLLELQTSDVSLAQVSGRLSGWKGVSLGAATP